MELMEYTKALAQVKTERDLPEHISFDEFKKIYYSLSGKDQLLCGLLWETGGRVSDVISLTWRDINFGEKTIKMFVEKRDIPITIPIGNAIISDLKNWRIHVKPDQGDFIFPSRSKFGRVTRQAVDKKVKVWGKIIYRKLHAHMWRHGIAIYLLKNGVHIKVISARLGHSNVFTTINSYLVITPELQRELTEHVPMR